MKRKIVKLGPATLVISLPNKWVRKFNIVAGNELEVVEEEKGLIIKTESNFKTEKEFLDFTKINKLLKRILASKYTKGTDEIEIKIDSLEKSRIIQKRVDEMIGMEVIEQSKDRLLIKDIQGTNIENFDNILRRVLYLINSLSEESLKSISKKETDLEYLQDIEKNINKFTDYCFRILNKKGYANYKNTSAMYCIIYLLEDLADEYKNLISYINENKIKLNNELILIYSKIDDYYKNLQKLFLKFDLEDAVNLADYRDKIIIFTSKQLKNTKSANEAIIIKNFERIIKIIIDIMDQLLKTN
ncbi:hypothetical protein J4440_03630 [Candidatus Woesearchaeota archaeon]|nr:hypothetical protein [Candidatus Woesearchaeota archaeon]